MLTSFLIILISFIPTLINEFYSNFENSIAFINFFSTISTNFGFNLEMFKGFFISQSFWSMINIIISVIIFIIYISYSFYLIKRKINKEVIFLISWTLITLLILITNISLQESAFNFEVIFPAMFLLMGFSFYELLKRKNKIILLFLLVLISFKFVYSLYILSFIITHVEGDVQNKISAVNFIIENSTKEIPKVKFDRHYIDNWDEKPFLYLFDYYSKNISIESENFDYVIIDPNYNKTLFDNYLNKTKFRIDFGGISVIKIK